MEGSFEDRVKRLFGTHLFESVPDNSFPASSWSVAAGEVERREWNRGGGLDDRENDPCASAFDDVGGCFERRSRSATRDRRKKDWEGGLDGVDDDDEEEEDEEGGADGKDGRGDGEREREEIRASVGLDPTLDREEEEDEYDRRAFNRENAGERMYMRDVLDHGPHLNFHNVVPDSLDDSHDEIHDFNKDPRADHFAASVRLNQDKYTMANGHSVIAHGHDDSPVLPQNKITESNVKPILKRKESQIDTKPKKRVRFDPGCRDEHVKDIEEAQNVPMIPQSVDIISVTEGTSHMPDESAGVPDYLRNPSKYTCYNLDGSDKDDTETNKHALDDFRKLVKTSNADLHESFMELPKSITFTSRKKSHEAMSLDNSSAGICGEQTSLLAAFSIGFAAGDTGEDDVCEMEEDETSVEEVSMRTTNRRADRKYRSKLSYDDST